MVVQLKLRCGHQLRKMQMKNNEFGGDDELVKILKNAEVIPKDLNNPNDDPDYVAIVDGDGGIKINDVYIKLDNLINSSEQLIEKFQYANIEAEGALSGMASIMTLVRNTASDFLKTHIKEQEFKQKMTLEALKIQAKQQQAERKHEMDLALVRAKKGLGVVEPGEIIETTAYSQESAVEKFKILKKEVKDEKNESNKK